MYIVLFSFLYIFFRGGGGFTTQPITKKYALSNDHKIDYLRLILETHIYTAEECTWFLQWGTRESKIISS